MINPLPGLRGFILRWTCPLFYKRIGRGCRFFGRVRMPLPFRNITLGERTEIGDSVYFQTGRKSHITLGRLCTVNTGCHLIANVGITIGDNVAIAEYVSIRDQEHKFSAETGVRGQGYDTAPVTIGSNVWIGRGVYIGPGTVIENGTIVGANSVVRGVFPPGVHIAGSPARIIRTLDGDNR
jgi:acetyltransferase-like isoleucine patch superfamily enzyme